MYGASVELVRFAVALDLEVPQVQSEIFMVEEANTSGLQSNLHDVLFPIGSVTP